MQLVAESREAKRLAIVLNTQRGSDTQRGTVGYVDADKTIPFSLSISANGDANLTVGSDHFDAGNVPIRDGEAKVFCSTGQFKFSDLVFASTNAASGAAGQ